MDRLHTTEIEAVEQMNAEQVAILTRHHDWLLTAEQEYWDDMVNEWTHHFDEKLADLQAAHAAELGKTIHHVEAINEATLKLQDRTVVIRTVHQTEYSTANIPRLQHGGPVRAGRPYMVGEAGPELFVPSRSGRIDPNVSSGGGVDAKEPWRKAVAGALDGDADGRGWPAVRAASQSDTSRSQPPNSAGGGETPCSPPTRAA